MTGVSVTHTEYMRAHTHMLTQTQDTSKHLSFTGTHISINKLFPQQASIPIHHKVNDKHLINS